MSVPTFNWINLINSAWLSSDDAYLVDEMYVARYTFLAWCFVAKLFNFWTIQAYDEFTLIYFLYLDSVSCNK